MMYINTNITDFHAYLVPPGKWCIDTIVLCAMLLQTSFASTNAVFMTSLIQDSSTANFFLVYVVVLLNTTPKRIG